MFKKQVEEAILPEDDPTKWIDTSKLTKIGEGAFGGVFDFDQTTVIKILKAMSLYGAVGPREKKWIAQEIKIHELVDHPNCIVSKGHFYN